METRITSIDKGSFALNKYMKYNIRAMNMIIHGFEDIAETRTRKAKQDSPEN
tara:strand:- start:319 stop:474 length:156 start_codon:yes stop_codon:yes gene_type:complete